MRNRGFTLIELLVVIAIIAILAAILFPVFMGAKERARQAMCLGHGGQLGKALTLYMDDHAGKFPLCWSTSTDGTTLTWAHLLRPYARSLRVFNCPSVPKRRFTGSTAPDAHRHADRITGGFGYNASSGEGAGANGVARGKNDNWNDPYRESDLQAPTQHISFADSSLNTDLGIYPGYTFCDVVEVLTQGKPWVPPDYRHNGGATFIFCDGHARWYTKTYFDDWQEHSHHWYVDNKSR